MPGTLRYSLSECQANFANFGVSPAETVRHNRYMGKRSRKTNEPMPTLREWRDSLGLSRPQVAEKIALLRVNDPVDQATVAKWESGETAVRVQDLKLLAEIYGVRPEQLLYSPTASQTVERMRQAYEVIATRDPAAVDRWLASGTDLKETPPEPAGSPKAA